MSPGTSPVLSHYIVSQQDGLLIPPTKKPGWLLGIQYCLVVFCGVTGIKFSFDSFLNANTCGEYWACLLISGLTIVMWVLVEVFLVWQLAVETVTVSAQSVKIKKHLSYFSRTREYAAEHIQRLRVTSDGRSIVMLYPLAFDYGASTIRFSYWAGEAANNEIRGVILAHFPQYGRAEMGVVKLKAPHYRLEQRTDELVITIPPRRRWLEIMLEVIILPGWGIICGVIGLITGAFLFSGISTIFEGTAYIKAFGAIGIPMVVIFLLTFVTMAGVGLFMLGDLLWQLAGRETISVTAHSMIITRHLFGFKHTGTYLAGHIQRLRVAQYRLRMSKSKLTLYPAMFDYGASTIRFGYRTNEAENNQILQAIWERFPRYGQG